MGKKKKLLHFAENRTFLHFIEPTYDELINGFDLKGFWKSEFFKNDHPLVIELGCGKGEYTVGLARKYPERNFLGIDRKGARMWRGAKTSHQEGMLNVGFVRTRIELIDKVFNIDEVNEIWITFPDPQPREKNERRRLVSLRFLEFYKKFLIKGGLIHLKTDDTMLFDFTLKVIQVNSFNLLFATDDLYHSNWEGEAKDFQTYYEKKFLESGEAIKYIIFKLD